jgi:hypothetical protein
LNLNRVSTSTLHLLMNIEVTRYRKADGYATRYWSVMVNGELLAVTVYRKGAEAVARAIANPIPHDPVMRLEDSPNPGTNPAIVTHGMATDQPGRPVRSNHSS